MQTVTSNTTQQINSALFALDRDIKNVEGNMDLQTQILNEAQTRSNADTALANSINNVSSELSQAQLTAYAYGVSGSAATAVTQVVTISGSTSYNAVAGSRVLVSFPNGYTPSNEDSELLLQIGNMAALPALAQGVAMKYGSVSAGAMIEFTYTGSAWCCQSNIVKATADYTLYADGKKDHTIYTDSFLSDTYSIAPYTTSSVSINNTLPENATVIGLRRFDVVYGGGGNVSINVISPYSCQLFNPTPNTLTFKIMVDISYIFD